ncbi:variant erythrocyte surface antigen-1 alpha subunit [Babesia bovis T2Bo]|uniref:Variant erythrocyte surface antigen-1, alpha subunit n=1 Tax=Babesia bovis TaxID=5865 RepID=A7AST8_BABBO|nr:variant erythrocyte surface antigen-1 alpha subunit [Babesia bovis T2Bo]EDO05999.1 variant erythrocyte surface antigen-1 alpha subunit [Babesia bovis T2Bo]|eukprot:XP_001609567.1 variant erythrocyte surface antigen-1, alpha subunit [Babesia bovis T2Bo]
MDSMRALRTVPDNVRHSGAPSTREIIIVQNSVELEYHGYEGESSGKGATDTQVKEHLNELFSLVQGLGGTAVVRTYIDQLAQVLSALVGWSRIDQCRNGSCGGNDKPHGKEKCEYLKDKAPSNKCGTCGCMKWVVIQGIDWVQLGRGCTKCKDSGGEEERKKQNCECGTDDEQECSPESCKCALAGKCCKCCCKDCSGKCKDAKCSCDKEKYKCHEEKKGENDVQRGDYTIESYMSAYAKTLYQSYVGGSNAIIRQPTWNDLKYLPDPDTPSQRRHQCARILLGSVCLIWSGITYMHWTGKWTKTSPYWNNHILDGSGIDDGTLSQWLQALGFPREMLNSKGPKNRLDQVIWDGFMGQLFLGFTHPTGVYGQDGNTAKQPYDMNYAGFVHTAHRDSFNEEASVFPKNSSSSTGQVSDINQHKMGAIFKLYILSCAYFTGLQKKSTKSAIQNTTPNTPKTIREILYWLSALPYSQGYKGILGYGKERLEKVLEHATEKKLKFIQTGRNAPITVDEFNLFAHFQAVTQYCPLVLIGIQGGIHSTDSTDSTKEPAIHSLYANTECNFTYPTVSIQAYNQVVHYIRALFYQLYFLRKQCAVKVALGGKWRECRYGKDVLGKNAISWMCLGCDPMEHDRKNRVGKVKGELVELLKKVEKGEESEDGEGDGGSESEETKQEDELAKKLNALLDAIGQVAVQLGNAQEVLEKKAENKAIEGVKKALGKAKDGLEKARTGLKSELGGDVEFAETFGYGKLKELIGNDGNGGLLGELTNGSGGALDTLANGSHAGSLQQITSAGADWQKEYSSAKDQISDAINKVRDVLKLMKQGVKTDELKKQLNGHEKALLNAIDNIEDIVGSTRCVHCQDHATKCGQPPIPSICEKCHQQYMEGTPSPLQAFLEDRLPGFSCDVVRNTDTDKDTVYPPAASHLGHCGGSGQCCPLPMGFRGQFYSGSITNCTGQRLYGILYFFSNENMMQSCVYTLVRVTAALSATTPQVLGDVFGFFRGGVGNPLKGKNKNNGEATCGHNKDPSNKDNDDYFCGWCASGLRDEVKKIEWIPKKDHDGGQYRGTVGEALIQIKGDKDTGGKQTGTTSLSTLTKDSEYVSPLTGELYTAVSATFGNTYLSWVLYLSDALEGGLLSLASAFKEIECRGCTGCDPNKCKKGHHGEKNTENSGQCGCPSIVSCTGVLPVLYRHGFSYGNPFNLEGYQQNDTDKGDYGITDKGGKKHCHEFLESLSKVLEHTEKDTEKKDQQTTHPLTELLKQVGKLQYDIRLPWIFVLTVAWLVAVLYLAFGAIWPLDWTHMRSHWLRGGEHQWQCMWYKVMTGRKGRVVLEGLYVFW